MYFKWALKVLFCLYATVASQAYALEHPEANLNETGVESRLGAQVDGNLNFTDSSGERVTFSEITSGNIPVILIPVYYDCPRLCGLVLSGVVQLLNKLTLSLGKEYKVLSVSINPEESSKLAAKRAKEYHNRLETKDIPEHSWRFLVGEDSQVRPLMETVGFGYKKDGKEFAHSAALFILTPEGKVSQYFTGIDFSAWDVRLALIEASRGGVGSAIDHVLLYCFRFDPTKGKYTLAVLNIIKMGGVLTLMGLGLVFYYATRRSVS